MQNRQLVLASRPVGVPQPEHFELVETTLPSLGEGEFLVENIYLSVDPAQRGYVNDEDNYAPPVAIGEVMRAMAVGRIIDSRHNDYAVGDYLYGWFGWQEYCICQPTAVLRKVDPAQAPLSFGAGLLGINGLTAWLALEDIGKLKSGETVLITAAAGAVGSIAGQLAKQAGCRTVAVTSSDDKGKQCVEEFGFDTWINYQNPLETELQRACPDGIDVFFDNVAGSIGDAIYGHMNFFGRVIQCGTVSIASWKPVPQGPRKERDILTRRLRVEGFVIFDHLARYDHAAQQLANLWTAGSLLYHEDIVDGIESAPQALVEVYAGRNRGKKLVRLRNEDSTSI
ncbi:MAG: NADP-dependent oxidoreductase [Tissierellales bacterium]